MKLDDRPVIDQLLNPTPLNYMHEVTLGMHDTVYNREGALRVHVERTFSECWDRFRDTLSADQASAFDEARRTFIVLAAADETDRHLRILNEFANELEARL